MTKKLKSGICKARYVFAYFFYLFTRLAKKKRIGAWSARTFFWCVGFAILKIGEKIAFTI